MNICTISEHHCVPPSQLPCSKSTATMAVVASSKSSPLQERGKWDGFKNLVCLLQQQVFSPSRWCCRNLLL